MFTKLNYVHEARVLSQTRVTAGAYRWQHLGCSYTREYVEICIVVSLVINSTFR